MQDERIPIWRAFDELLAAADHLYATAPDDPARQAATDLIDLMESAVAIAVSSATGTARA